MVFQGFFLDSFRIFFYIFFKNLFAFFLKLLRLLLKVTTVTTGYQKWPKIGQNSIVGFFPPKGKKKPLAKGQSPLQELEVGPRSVP